MSHSFSLHGKGLKLNTRADVVSHLQGVDPTCIEEIHLGGNTVGVEAAEALAEFLAKTTVLKVADFADIFTGRLISEIPQALSALCDALKDKTSLVEINLSDNAFGGRSVEPMVPFLVHNRSFQILRLNNNGLGPEGGAVVARALLESAQLSKKEGKPSNLRTVICGRNRLEDGSAPTWAEAFAEHGTLVEVCMPQNGIRQDGVIALAHGLSKCPGLHTLDLQDNAFNVDGSEDGSKAMAKALPLWPNLERLNFSDCVLSNDGEIPAAVSVLAAGSNPKLHTLQLQNNNLETSTFALLAESVGNHLSALRTLELQWNEVEDDDASLETLSDALKGRGGKLVTNDEDEDEDDKDEDDDGAEDTGGNLVERPDEAADALADLMGKVAIN